MFAYVFLPFPFLSLPSFLLLACCSLQRNLLHGPCAPLYEGEQAARATGTRKGSQQARLDVDVTFILWNQGLEATYAENQGLEAAYAKNMGLEVAYQKSRTLPNACFKRMLASKPKPHPLVQVSINWCFGWQRPGLGGREDVAIGDDALGDIYGEDRNGDNVFWGIVEVISFGVGFKGNPEKTCHCFWRSLLLDTPK